MSGTKKLFIYAGGALLIATAILLAVRSRSNPGAASAKIEQRQAHSPKSREIFGAYAFTKETSNQTVLPGAEVVLELIRPDVLALRAVKTDEVFTDVGSFSIADGRITISLPEAGRTAKNAEYSYDGSQLVLPVLIFGEGEGNSTWVRVSGEDDPLSEAVGRFHGGADKESRRKLLAQLAGELKQSPGVRDAKLAGERVLAVTYASGYQEYFLAPELAAGPGKENPAEEGSSTRPRVYPVNLQLAQFLPPVPGLGRPPVLSPEEKFANWLRYEPEPISHGDAPSSKNALLLSAFYSLPVLIPSKEGKPVHYMTFQDAGENLDEIAAELTQAGYKPEKAIDQKVSLKNLYQWMKQPWGVLYINTHSGLLDESNTGGDALLSTGEQIPLRSRGSAELREKYLQATMKEAFGADYEKFKPCVMVGFIYEDIPFIAVKSCFFRVAGADFSSSLVFLNGCESAQSSMLRSALNAKSLVGWKHEVQAQLAAEINGPFWRCLRRKTRADREATFYAIEYLWQRNGYYRNMADIYRNGTFDPHNFVVYRQSRSEPEHAFTFNESNFIRVVREWVCQRKACKGLEETVAALYKCDKTNTGLGAAEFCKLAFNGVDVPDKEIDSAKAELGGSQGPRLTLVEK
jgi:hypothetical protein